MVAVGIRFDRDADTARKFVNEKKLSWTQIWAEKAEKSPLADRYGVGAIPATFLVGRYGNVIGRDLRGDALLQAVQRAAAKLKSTSDAP